MASGILGDFGRDQANAAAAEIWDKVGPGVRPAVERELERRAAGGEMEWFRGEGDLERVVRDFGDVSGGKLASKQTLERVAKLVTNTALMDAIDKAGPYNLLHGCHAARQEARDFIKQTLGH